MREVENSTDGWKSGVNRQVSQLVREYLSEWPLPLGASHYDIVGYIVG